MSDGWTNRWMDGWLLELMTDRKMDGCLNEWWIDKWMDEWVMDGRMLHQNTSESRSSADGRHSFLGAPPAVDAP